MFKSFSLLAAVSAVALCVPSMAEANSVGDWYVSVSGGWVHGVDADDQTINSVTASTDADNGWVAAAAIGKRYGSWRAEAEIAYREVDIDATFTSGATSETGSTDSESLSVMANGYYDFTVDNSKFSPYLGAGLGIASVENGDIHTTSFVGIGSDETEAAYQLMGGVNYKLTEKTSVGVGYRFFDTFDDVYGGSHEAVASVSFGF